MSRSGNLVIALHSPIFSGECFFAAGDYGGNVLVSTVLQKEGGMGAGGSNRALQVTPPCAVCIMEPVV